MSAECPIHTIPAMPKTIAPEHTDMNQPPSDHVTSVEQLEALYGLPSPRALIKELDHISHHYQAFIELSPFVVVATSGPEGLDCSPRGDQPGFVRVVDRQTVILPDRRGNNRLDTLRNIVRDPRISLLFLIPGVGETLRINGTATIITTPELCAQHAVEEKVPKSVIVISVKKIYFQCQKAIVRSQLWNPATQIPRSALPTAGQILQEISNGEFDGDAYDKGYPEYMKGTIY